MESCGTFPWEPGNSAILQRCALAVATEIADSIRSFVPGGRSTQSQALIMAWRLGNEGRNVKICQASVKLCDELGSISAGGAFRSFGDRVNVLDGLAALGRQPFAAD